MKRATGLRRATEAQRGAARLYRGVGEAPRAVSYPIQQPIARVIDQVSLPACVGCAMCAGAEAALGTPPNLSWVRIWTDARRRDGAISRDDYGTWFSSAIQSVMLRGLDPEEPGEWSRIEEMTESDDLDSELGAYDNRQHEAEHWRVPDGDFDALDEALARGLAVGIATGVRDQYFAFFSKARAPSEIDVVLTTAALGGDSNGHEQRIVAVELVGGVRQYLVQNSWGLAGGAHLPDGAFELGLARVNEGVVRAAWDIDCLAIRRR